RPPGSDPSKRPIDLCRQTSPVSGSVHREGQTSARAGGEQALPLPPGALPATPPAALPVVPAPGVFRSIPQLVLPAWFESPPITTCPVTRPRPRTAPATASSRRRSSARRPPVGPDLSPAGRCLAGDLPARESSPARRAPRPDSPAP